MSAEGVTGSTLPDHGRGPGSIPVSALHLRSDAKDEARALVLEYHYSHRWPSTPQFIVTWHEPGGLFGDRGPAVAAAVFGPVAGRWKECPLELSRLVRVPELAAPLTSLIASAASEIKAQGIADLLVSWADSGRNHHGGIYQAASWQYAGLSPGAAEYMIDGLPMHSLMVKERWGTRVQAVLERKLGERFGGTVPGSAKHLYWRALNRKGKAKAVRLGLKSLPYPKPGMMDPGG